MVIKGKSRKAIRHAFIAGGVLMGSVGQYGCGLWDVKKDNKTVSSDQQDKDPKDSDKPSDGANVTDDFKFFSEQFADLAILRYRVPGFEKLSLERKILLYYLSQAALAGRDILWDQYYKHNLAIRRTLENIVNTYKGDRNTPEFKEFMVYTKRVWFSNGIHHHYANDKFQPGFSLEYFKQLVAQSDSQGFPVRSNETVDHLIQRLAPPMFDPNVDNKKVSLDSTHDMVRHSAVNFYEGLTQHEVEDYYATLSDPNDESPISLGLNNKLVKADGKVMPRVYKVGGMYSKAIEKIVYWLEKAKNVADTPVQKQSFEKLISFYRSGNLKDFDAYNILWVQDTEAVVDTINGFIENYSDPLHHTGSWEAVVSIKDLALTEKFSVLGHDAQWFEDHSPILPEHKRKEVVGVSYKVITVVQESGESSPSTPIGINLPNADWIRKKHGSKSVSLRNIEDSYKENEKTSGVMQEFFLPEQQEWIKEHGEIADKLATGLHEVIGHASGQLMPGVGNPDVTLKNYASCLEEARADLVALYYVGDKHLVDLGITPSTDVIKAEYSAYVVNGLVKQLARLELGKDVEEAHMRNRQLISAWVYEHGKPENVVEKKIINGKTYFVVNDFQKMRHLIGLLLREVQRIKSTGDYAAGKALVETYGVKVDPQLHAEVKDRWNKLNVAPYKGFINPKLVPVMDNKGKITDVKVEYPTDFTKQMLEYAREHSFLPTEN